MTITPPVRRQHEETLPCPRLPPAINFHILRACDARCTFCFATFRETQGRLRTRDALKVLDLLRAAGAEKINFAGGEPTLHPDLHQLVLHAHHLGFTTSVITNGSRLEKLLKRTTGALDWVGLSVDSASEETQFQLGRGSGDHVARARRLVAACRAAAVRVKINTVVTALSWQEDMSSFIRDSRPERWKVFQVLRVEDQNDGDVESLLISREQFEAFVQRHAFLAEEGLAPVPESNDAMIDSYAMIDPMGRFFGNTNGRHQVGPAILELGALPALNAVGFQEQKLVARGGIYAWSSSSGARRRLPMLPSASS